VVAAERTCAADDYSEWVGDGQGSGQHLPFVLQRAF
jgi:hypothetical protein